MPIIYNIATEASKYRMLKMTIAGTLNAHKKLLKHYEADLKQYIVDDVPQPLINVQQNLIIKLKAKIEVLTDLK